MVATGVVAGVSVAVTGQTVVNEVMVSVITYTVLDSAGQLVMVAAQLVMVRSVVTKTVLVVIWTDELEGALVMVAELDPVMLVATGVVAAELVSVSLVATEVVAAELDSVLLVATGVVVAAVVAAELDPDVIEATLEVLTTELEAVVLATAVVLSVDE